VAPVIHYYQHTESGTVHGFTHPLPKEIAKQLAAGELARVADPSGADPDEEIARLRAQVAQLAELSGIDPSSLGPAGLADTAGSGDEPTADDGSGEQLPPDPDADADADGEEELHLCLECGEPVERNGRTGPWPQRHRECK